MNKIIITLIVDFTLSAVGFAQNETEEVIPIENTSKNILFERGFRWFAIYCNNSNYILRLKDKENGELLGKIVLTDEFTIKGSLMDWVSALDREITTKVIINTLVSIICKDNRYKYKITTENVVIEKGPNGNFARTQKNIDVIAKEIEKRKTEIISNAIRSIRKHMEQKGDFEENKDW